MSTGPGSLVGVARRAVGRAWLWAREHPWKAGAAVAALAVGGVGLLALGASPKELIAAGLLLVMVVAALPDPWKAKALEGLGALLAAMAGLIGANVLVFDPLIGLAGGTAADSRFAIVVGLLFAALAFAAMSWWYVRFRGHWGPRASLVFAIALALVAVFGAPFLFDRLEGDDERRGTLVARPVPSKLDVLIVSERPPATAEDEPLPELEPQPPPVELGVRWSVGFRSGTSVRWVLRGSDDPAAAIDALVAGEPGDARPPERREDADRLVLLLVDGTPPLLERPEAQPEVAATPGEVERWRRVARAAAGGRAPAYALLQTTDPERRRDWTDPDSAVRPVSVQQELGDGALTDLALQLAVGAPSSREDFELALRHQPVLLFDTDEPVPRPLSVDALFRDGNVRQCEDGGASTTCGEPVLDPRRLRNGGKRLELELPRSSSLRRRAREELAAVQAEGPAALAMGRPLSAMYVHPTAREVNGRRRLYLDYWWYLPDNPTRAGWGAFCGAGLVIPGVTCFDHQSDWEGVTVIVDRTERRGVVRPEPKAVHYAQHDTVVRYGWDQLRRHWDGDAGLPQRVAGVPGIEERPLVFVAKGTHASYATRCPGLRRSCRQLAHDLEEQEHDGLLAWGGNYTALCGAGSSCLQLLPTRVGGTQPALWNAFDGPWGARRCVLGIYCNSTDPPPGPARQGRYRRPALAHGTGNLESGGRPFEPGTIVDE